MISPTDFDDFTSNGPADYDAYFGTPTHDDHVLFELLVVGILQVGLSWQAAASQLPKLRQHMAGLRVEQVAGLDEPDWEQLMQTDGIMHNGRKLRAIITDARAIIQLQREYGSFSAYLWAFVDATPLLMPAPDDELPTRSALGTRVAKDLHKHGFTFVGPVVTQMFLLAAGIIKLN
ncbi:DNA-3-methyladenine glycosylase I [Lactiplantibacillus mudanjiangensis]|uniref:DNA-3-methyladenine glycosylase I [Lactobacillus plantarum subsp. plantarum ST-III] n=1 Tax=Lactiplantibacillus mudanjiangensis TaxID=1296538 RepID=A0A660DV29_9LACO|nr:DNA-3-methyladenine glycosylase I [Lactiplantibacillus mudanjiangensis]VDG20377.1 DNA-3-methyladenine glycosylase I [Lactobacillus plantarum subsp. plantarum ST-III] [Lactiplantibacillus mudanjiangensis]VDG23927.1 DNA-3-methyladenine glycosylase I [Lactobacillus plantarum subsp. plantarum ST-III] [Lactiplantibacillus mudanjiangensis]VDG27103.1 DNA-3-methyladenine glycosylase I [Lactobacillus plantarum subsp. plantarum ST-III] [Lactiplantibacillus mudanjiangensis]VDG33992.1 DNA-3-methyladenin